MDHLAHCDVRLELERTCDEAFALLGGFMRSSRALVSVAISLRMNHSVEHVLSFGI
jgi:hypothetical protein